MQGRAFLELARDVVLGGTEKHWRCTVGRAYYAVVLECRDALARWGYPLPPGESVHRWVRMRFDYPAHADLNFIGTRTGRLARLRNQADCDLSALAAFASDARALDAIQLAANAIDLLDTIEADPARLTTAVNAIKAAFP
jgi:hypothetical protein